MATIRKSNIKIIAWGKINTQNTQIYDRSLSWLGIYTLEESGGFI